MKTVPSRVRPPMPPRHPAPLRPLRPSLTVSRMPFRGRLQLLARALLRALVLLVALGFALTIAPNAAEADRRHEDALQAEEDLGV